MTLDSMTVKLVQNIDKVMLVLYAVATAPKYAFRAASHTSKIGTAPYSRSAALSPGSSLHRVFRYTASSYNQ
jgi:hypothetical protein